MSRRCLTSAVLISPSFHPKPGATFSSTVNPMVWCSIWSKRTGRCACEPRPSRQIGRWVVACRGWLLASPQGGQETVEVAFHYVGQPSLNCVVGAVCVIDGVEVRDHRGIADGLTKLPPLANVRRKTRSLTVSVHDRVVQRRIAPEVISEPTHREFTRAAVSPFA